MSIEPTLLRHTQITTMLGVHCNTIWNWVKDGRFPKPIKWDGITVWQRSDIAAFVESLAGQLAGCGASICAVD